MVCAYEGQSILERPGPDWFKSRLQGPSVFLFFSVQLLSDSGIVGLVVRCGDTVDTSDQSDLGLFIELWRWYCFVKHRFWHT